MPAHGSALAAQLLAREQIVLDRYRDRLASVRSPLATNADLWDELALQAQRVVRDCAATLSAGSVRLGEMHLLSVVDMATRRGVRGVHPKNSVRAAVALFDVVLTEVTSLLAAPEDGAHVTAEVAHALNQGIGARLEAGAVGYDTFLLNQVREVVDADRRELAREIHDRLGNSVSLAMRKLELACHAVPAEAEASLHEVCEARAVLADALEELRELIGGLRRSRAEGALRSALNAYVASVRVDEPEVCVVVNGVESWASPHTLDEVFLILRECLRNIFTHAEARQVTLKVDVAPHELRAAVEDDGIGFDPDAVRHGHGLTAMRERTENLNGRLSVRGAVGEGTRVTLWIPLAEWDA